MNDADRYIINLATILNNFGSVSIKLLAGVYQAKQINSVFISRSGFIIIDIIDTTMYHIAQYLSP